MLVHGPLCVKKINGFSDLDLKTTDNMSDDSRDNVAMNTPFHLCFQCHVTLKIQEDISPPQLPPLDDVPRNNASKSIASKKVNLVAIYKMEHIHYTAEAINPLDKAAAGKKARGDSASAPAALDPKKHTRLQAFLKRNDDNTVTTHHPADWLLEDLCSCGSNICRVRCRTMKKYDVCEAIVNARLKHDHAIANGKGSSHLYHSQCCNANGYFIDKVMNKTNEAYIRPNIYFHTNNILNLIKCSG